jgi:ATP-dependent helicase/nuclease subunit A
MRFVPQDEKARERARSDHATSLVLEAGAGTGKTTLLVDRILELVVSGRATLERIVAVTFTENAATTLKLRLREELEARRAEASLGTAERGRVALALETLERAPISTIHALCAAILQERPLECGVVPGFRVADDAETDLLFAAAWDEWLADRLVIGDPVLVEALDQEIPLEALSSYGERGSLRGLARTLIDQRDLEPLVGQAPDVLAWREELRAQALRALELCQGVPEADALAARLHQLAEFAVASQPLEGEALAAHLRRLPTIPRNLGFRPRWGTDAALEEARGIAAWTHEAQQAWSAALGASLHGDLARALLSVVAGYERRKQQAGVLDFLDLLVKTRRALKEHEGLRRYFRERYRYLLIDEFQDTDPLQVEIAELLAGEAPGRLVVVGDAKQSIYRFRRAEVRLFRRLSEQAASRKGWDVVPLTQNFRSRPAIVRFVNRAFAELIQASDDSGQPPYAAIVPPPGLEGGPAVVGLRFEAPFAERTDLLEAEALALARLIAAAAHGHYRVRDPTTGQPRPSRGGDVMVLVRRLTQLRPLEESLEAAGLRFAVEGGKSFFDRQEVHEVLAVLHAIEDPSDRVSLVAALRSSFFGVSDRDIVSYSLSGGRLRFGAIDGERPGASGLAPALRLLETLHQERTQRTPAALLERLYDETRIAAALTGNRRGEAALANLEKVVALARQSVDLGVLTLRGFVALLKERIAGAREEPDLPPSRVGDPDTLRILSIHKAKGLEAPIVALHDTADSFLARNDVIALWEKGQVAIGFRKGCQPPGWDELVRLDQRRAWAEARRLLYVACTRARDLLVIPKPPTDARVGDFWKDLIEKLPAHSDEDVELVDADTLPEPSVESTGPDLRALALAAGGDAVATRWDAEREERIAAGRWRPFRPIAVTERIAAEAPPRVEIGAGTLRGREFGRLVHQLLEWIPLDVAEPKRAALSMASALAPRLGLGEPEAEDAAAAVARVLAMPLLDRARRSPHVLRELRLWFPDGSDLVEGMVDLVFEEDDGLVVVDYKTDAIRDDQAVAQAAHHAPQLQLYGRGLAQATKRSVRERLVLFTALGRAVPV